MNTTVAISPVQFYPTTAGFLQIADVYVNIAAQTANCQVTFLDTGSNAINSSAQRWYMDTGTYANWAGDDQFFISACVSGMGLTPVTGSP